MWQRRNKGENVKKNTPQLVIDWPLGNYRHNFGESRTDFVTLFGISKGITGTMKANDGM